MPEKNRELDFVKISPPERKRIYYFPNEHGLLIQVVIEGVEYVCVRPSGTHRLVTSDGMHEIIPPGWVRVSLDIDDWTF